MGFFRELSKLGSAFDDAVTQPIVNTVKDAGSQLDDFVNTSIPGGWTIPLIIAAAYVTGGASLAAQTAAAGEAGGAVAAAEAAGGVAALESATATAGGIEALTATVPTATAAYTGTGLTAGGSGLGLTGAGTGGIGAGLGTSAAAMGTGSLLGTGAAAGGIGAGVAGLSSYLQPAAILGSSLLGANAASNAANTQAAAQREANQLAYSMFKEQQAAQEPWRQAGIGALGKLTAASDYTPFGMDQFNADPGYGFRLSEGQKALDRSAAARGGLISGSALKAATRYGQDMGSQEYTNAFNRYQTERQAKLGPLQSLAGVGQSATNQMGVNAANYSNTAGQGLTNIGNVQAAGGMGQANALAGGVSQYLNYSNNNDLLNVLARRTT
jgi:hypothetical protein